MKVSDYAPGPEMNTLRSLVRVYLKLKDKVPKRKLPKDKLVLGDTIEDTECDDFPRFFCKAFINPKLDGEMWEVREGKRLLRAWCRSLPDATANRIKGYFVAVRL